MTSEAVRASPPDRFLLGPHRLAARDFDALASGGADVAVLRQLRASEHSQRLLLLRTLLDTVRGRLDAFGPLPTADQAWDLLVQTERSDAAQVAAVLDYPATGLWAALTLRRLRGRRFDDSPLWVEVGHLHAIAAAAAIRAGLSFRTLLPVRRGIVVLPTLGHARLPGLGPWETAELVVGDRPPRLVTAQHEVFCADDARDAAWLPLSTITVEPDGSRLRAVVDDMDPYRHVVHSAMPVPLQDGERERWRTVFAGAWRILARDHPDQAVEVTELLRSVVPTAAAPRFLAGSASSGDAFGSALLSVPDGDIQLAATLVHEMQHAKLGALLHLVDLYTPGDGARFYTPWRDDPRPVGGVLQGIYAFLGVTRFWRRQRVVSAGNRAAAAHFEFALWREGVRRATDVVLDRPELTALGHRFLANLSTVLAGWLTEPVPGAVLRLAQAVHDDHRSGWRLHHLRPRDEAVADLAEAWTDGRRPPADALHAAPSLSADPKVAGLAARAVLVRHLLHDGRPPRTWPPSSADLGRQVRGAIPADLAWLAGDAPAATAGFEQTLDRAPADPHAWTGLGLAARDSSDDSAALALVERPELVRAVHRVLSAGGRVDPPARLELARWLGRDLRVRSSAREGLAQLDRSQGHRVDVAVRPNPAGGVAGGWVIDS
ncbi:HEXXH motif domain-containing protein [Frankia sp. AiPs1]|uniref:HEXXH motif domain-containing protein n=1 Tax=Frankia sp. AiPs1 TaxID=573493 RepID=UPI002043CB62|nr:HEXXH motif domain-containing protein [Frankia sp. AiPs1]MCM3921083.1 HEXXH motif domain-containing protein [Frankia sp. AiPs1]